MINNPLQTRAKIVQLPFHVVSHRTGIKGLLVTHSVYENNKPFLKPPRGKKLSRRMALGIAHMLNTGCVS